MDSGVVYEVIFPLLEVNDTALICISTPLGAWNFYSEFTEYKYDNGKHVFNVKKVGMVCERCLGTEHEASCNHPTGDRPEWKPEEALDKMRAMYGDRLTLLKREILGQIADDDNSAFEPRTLKALFQRAPAAEPHAVVSEVYVSVDPNGGGTRIEGSGSECAVVSFYFEGANLVVSFACARAAAESSIVRRREPSSQRRSETMAGRASSERPTRANGSCATRPQ